MACLLVSVRSCERCPFKTRTHNNCTNPKASLWFKHHLTEENLKVEPPVWCPLRKEDFLSRPTHREGKTLKLQTVVRLWKL